MPSAILIPVAIDHEPLTERKLEMARQMLAPGGRITLLTVLEQVSGFAAEFDTTWTENHLTKKIMEKLKQVAGGAPDITCEVTTGKPGMRIAEYAGEMGADLIIVGSHRPGLQDYFLGSTASRVVRRAPCSVLVMR